MDYEQRVLQYKGPMRGGRVVVQDMPHKLATRCLLSRLFDAMLLKGASRGSSFEDLNASGMSKNHAIAGPAVCLHSSSRRWQPCRKGEQHVDRGKRKGRYS
jgi:hypothetical protein